MFLCRQNFSDLANLTIFNATGRVTVMPRVSRFLGAMPDRRSPCKETVLEYNRMPLGGDQVLNCCLSPERNCM